MAPGTHERILDTLSDLDARLAGLQVGYSEPNARAAEEHVATLGEFFESEPEAFAALSAVGTLVFESWLALAYHYAVEIGLLTFF